MRTILRRSRVCLNGSSLSSELNTLYPAPCTLFPGESL